MRDPAFWWRERSAVATLLTPAARLYGAVAARQMAGAGRHAPIPVVCVGNFTLGGAGKTPTAIALSRYLAAAGFSPFFISRGYGGRFAGPVRVAGHSAREVGDEPLLLARVAPTIVSRDRYDGAVFAAAAGADVLVMDDGLQNPSLEKNFSLAVVDGARGVGNAHVFPAGPLRAALTVQFDRVDAVLVVGAQNVAPAPVIDEAHRRGLPVFRGQLQPDAAAVGHLAGRPCLAFAGIAHPAKFFATLDACGIPAPVRVPFPDHHRFRPQDISALVSRADRDGLTLITTEKDLARMRGEPWVVDLVSRIQTLPVTMEFADDALGQLVIRSLQGAGRHGRPTAANQDSAKPAN